MYGKSLRKTIAAKKNVACLFESIVIRKIDIIKISGNRCTLSVEFKVCRLYSVLFHVSYSSGRLCPDLSDECLAAQISTLNG